ncbi:MAG: ATP-binding cassette domain-containing protein [Geminicoccaceae bacterium]
MVTAAVLAHPEVKATTYPGAQLLGNVAVYMRAAGKKQGEIFNFGFDASPQIVKGFKDGWIQLAADQQPFQQGYLPVLSLCQQIIFGLSPISFDTSTGFVTAENLELIDEIGFPPDLSPYSIVGELSGGERQGVALARAMSHNCALLVLDDPTNALSRRETDHFMRSLQRVRHSGCAVLLVGHNLRQVAEIADHIVILHRGRVALETSRSAVHGADHLEQLLDGVIRHPQMGRSRPVPDPQG